VKLDTINRILAKGVMAAGILFMIGSIALLMVSGAEQLILFAAFGATAAAFAANRLSMMDGDGIEPAPVVELIQAA
jgi:hypothetical protein